jgi:hypothetical protein
MTNSTQNILKSFQSFIGKHGNDYAEWYVSTSEDPRLSLIREHKFRTGDTGFLRQARSEAQAAQVTGVLTGLGARGGPNQKPGAHYVYAYKLSPHTRP